MLMFHLRRGSRLAVACGAGLVAWLGGDRVQAQGFGGFGGFGWGLGYQTPASVNFLNDHAIARVGSVAARQPQNLTAPIPVSRDVDFFNRYDAATRQAMEDRVARNPRGTITRPAPALPITLADSPSPARQIPPLSSFFNKMRQIVWPADAPTHADLAEKRAASDAKTLEFFNEFEMRGFGMVATATEARSKLLDYGRPALRSMRENSTTAVSDAFHSFLLSLYDSIEESTKPPRR
jgi:hypothetical protein